MAGTDAVSQAAIAWFLDSLVVKPAFLTWQRTDMVRASQKFRLQMTHIIWGLYIFPTNFLKNQSFMRINLYMYIYIYTNISQVWAYRVLHYYTIPWFCGFECKITKIQKHTETTIHVEFFCLLQIQKIMDIRQQPKLLQWAHRVIDKKS